MHLHLTELKAAARAELVVLQAPEDQLIIEGQNANFRVEMNGGRVIEIGDVTKKFWRTVKVNLFLLNIDFITETRQFF